MTYAVVGCGSHGDHRGCGQLWIVEDLRASATATCPHCETTHKTDQLKKLGESDDWKATCEMRSRIMADRSNGYDGNYKEDVDHYALLAERVDQQLDEFHAAGTATPDCLGNVVRVGDLLDAHTARSDVYTPDANARVTTADVADAIVEDPDYEPEPAEREQFLEILADDHLEPNHSTVELPETPDPDDRYPEQGSVRVTSGLQSDLTNTVRNVSPSRANALPKLLDPLTDACVEAVEAISDDERQPVGSLLSTPDPNKPTGVHHLADEYGIDAGNGTFGQAVVDAARHDHVPEDARDYLTKYGTGQDLEDTHLDALRRGHCALLRAGGVTPTLHVELDADAWTTMEDRRKGERFFEAIDLLATAVDVTIVAGDAVSTVLAERFGEWAERHEIADDLTDGRDTSRPPTRDESEADRRDAYDALGALNSGGRYRLVGNLFADQSRSVRSLQNDAEIDLAPDSINRYTGDLEAAGLVAIDRDTTGSNQITLTDTGKLAKDCLTPDYSLVSPEQGTLDSASYHPMIDSQKYSVSDGPGLGTAPPADSPAEWLAATGDADADGAYVRWMDGRGSNLDAYTLHRRCTAASRGDGITLTDAPVRAFEDGRVTQVSLMEGTLHAVTQWGGAAATLGRIAAALSTGRIWGTALDREAVTDLCSDLGSAPQDVLEFLQRGIQIGWINAESVIDQDGLDYLAIRDHLYQVGRSVLARLSRLEDMEDDERREYFRDAHGLLASMTALLDRVGVDTTIQLRFPEGEAARTNENVRNDVVSFLAKTAPKQSRYGAHSGWRQVVESRPDKLKYRLPMEVDPTNRTADLTASWVVVGDGMDELREDVVAALDDVQPRDAIRDGNEEGIAIDVPVHIGGTYTHARSVVENLISKKGWSPARQDTGRVTRALLSVLSHAPGRVSPLIVADALLGMGANEHKSDLRMADVRAGLARVDSEELFPTLAPSVGKLVRALVTADGRLEAGALADAAGIHRRTYATHMETLGMLDLVNRTDDGWGLTLEPWWAPEADREPADPTARTLATGDTILPDQPRSETEVLSELANALAWRGETDTSAADLRLDLGRQPTVDELNDAIPTLAKWAAPIAAHWPSETVKNTLPAHDPPAISGFSNAVEKTGTTLPPYDPGCDQGCSTATIGVVSDHEQQSIACRYYPIVTYERAGRVEADY
ncbi:DUF5817 domain-containing protein [Halorubrum aethiopicum]|uniref:DUF5817 domain-containing protein n=1 Tax=Halorubrum aethiopicum TaxID=1758255 RepID=UPI0008363392|nr:DUF5817 domain-containing protein [Halorubrum aethiopicum]